MKKNFLVIFFIFFTIHCFALDMDNFDINENTPEANSLMKYINNPVDYSRGLTDITIPLYQIKSGGLTLPINLSYYHGGLKVNEYSKWIGQGWTLNAEPTITRVIRGQEDRLDNIMTPPVDRTYTSNELYQLCYNLTTHNLGRDEEPDIFYYKLLNRSGSFILRKKTTTGPVTAVTIPYDPIRVSIVDNNTAIQITDDNGNVYKFDVTERSSSSYSIIPSPPDKINSWKCSSIKNEAGKILFQFKYMDGIPEKNAMVSVNSVFEDWNHSGSTSRTNIPSILYYNREKGLPTWTERNYQPGFYTMSLGVGATIRNNTRTITMFPKRLRSIKFENDSIVLDQCTIKGLNKTINLRNSTIDDESFIYGDYVACPVLDAVEIIASDNKVEFFNFQYYGMPPARPKVEDLLRHVDFWGNYSKKSDIVYNINLNYKTNPNQVQSRDSVFKFQLSDLFQGEGEASNVGLLKSIVNTAGCKTEFTYESNCYVKEIHDFAGTSSDIETTFESGDIVKSGGLRIKEINYSDPTGSKLTRVFKYGKLKQAVEDGIGIIKRQINVSSFMDNQRRFLYYSSNTDLANSTTRLRTIYSSLKGKPTFSGNPVVYDRVTEYTTKTDAQGTVIDNGKTVYSYNFYGSWDGYDNEISTQYNAHYVDKLDDWKYGQLLSKQIYKKESDGSYNIISSSNFEYDKVGLKDTVKFSKVFQECVFDINGNTNPNILDMIVMSSPINPCTYFNVSLGEIYSYKQYAIETGIMKMTSETDSTFCDNVVVTSKTDYTYGSVKHLYPTLITKINSNNKSQIQTLKYALDTLLSTSYLGQNPEHVAARNKLIADWNIRPVLEETKQIGTSVSTSYNSYKIFPNYVAPLVSKQIYELNNLGKQEQVTCENYDNYGNPVCLIKSDLIKTVYLWSYGGQFPIAEIVNATYSDVQSALGYSSTYIESTLSANTNPDVATIGHKLRDYFYNTPTLITTYTYKPFVGITSKTDTRGMITYYDYDSFGRLKEEYFKKNNLKKIVKSYDYHYRNQ